MWKKELIFVLGLLALSRAQGQRLKCLDPGTNAEIGEGEVYFPDIDNPCFKCECVQGEPQCIDLECEEMTVCKDGSVPYKVEGECCVQCPGIGVWFYQIGKCVELFRHCMKSVLIM